MLQLSLEIKRKLLHLCNIWVVFSYELFGYSLTSKLLYILLIMVFMAEFLRTKNSNLGEFIRRIIARHLHYVMNSNEKSSITSVTKMLILSVIMINVMKEDLFVLAFAVLVIADAVAAIVGIKYGELNSKSLEGSVAFLLTSIVISFICWGWFHENHIYLFVALIAAGVATLMELFSRKINIDDNVLIPLVYMASSWLYKVISQFPTVKPW